jgi:hypothetical protein
VCVGRDPRGEYVERKFKHAMLDQISLPLGALLRGFYDVRCLSPFFFPSPLASSSPFGSRRPRPSSQVVPLAELERAALDPGELEITLCGLVDLDIDDWKANTTYHGRFQNASMRGPRGYVTQVRGERRAARRTNAAAVAPSATATATARPFCSSARSAVADAPPLPRFRSVGAPSTARLS